jgi:glycosyltransferase involved in cell wall biosynthesis
MQTPTSQSVRIGEGPGQPGLVTVVIPSFNRAYIVGQAIESVLAQTYRPVEVVVVDDGSTDDTRRVVEGYGAPVRYIRQDNAGVSAARNTGLAHARGELVGLLDSDDVWLPWKLEAQVAVLRRFPEVGMVWTDMTAVDPEGHLVARCYLRKFYSAYSKVRIEDYLDHAGSVADHFPAAPAEVALGRFRKGDLFSAMLLGNLVHTSTALLRRERLRRVGGFDVSLARSGEDYDFHWRTCREGPVGMLDVPTIVYRTHASDQLTANAYQIYMARNNLRTVLARLEQDGAQIALSEETKARQLAEAYAWVGEEELTATTGRALRPLMQSLRLRPLAPGVTAKCLLSLVPARVYRLARATKRALRGWGRRA